MPQASRAAVDSKSALHRLFFEEIPRPILRLVLYAVTTSRRGVVRKNMISRNWWRDAHSCLLATGAFAAVNERPTFARIWANNDPIGNIAVRLAVSRTTIDTAYREWDRMDEFTHREFLMQLQTLRSQLAPEEDALDTVMSESFRATLLTR